MTVPAEPGHWIEHRRQAVRSLTVPPRLQSTLEDLWPIDARNHRGRLALHILTLDHRIPVGGFSAYLGLADRIYGRVATGSLQRYRRRASGHLVIDEVRRGSVHLIIREALEGITSPSSLVLTGLALKYLPDVIKAPATAYHEYQEGRLAAAKRKRILARAAADEQLGAMDKTSIGQLASLLSRIYATEQGRIAAAQAFAIQAVKDIHIDETTA